MKVLTLPFLIAISLSACSSVEVADSMPNPDQAVVEDRLNISTDLNATYCEGKGFEKFMEREKYYTFTCKNGAFFNIAK